MEETKKDNKKKSGKARPESSGDVAPGSDVGAGDLARAVTALHDRLSALAFEITALRGDLGGAKSAKSKRASPAPPVQKSVATTFSASPDEMLAALHAGANVRHGETGDAVAMVLTAFAQAPGTDGDDAALQSTILCLQPDAARQSTLRDEREGTLCERAARIAASLGRRALLCLLAFAHDAA